MGALLAWDAATDAGTWAIAGSTGADPAHADPAAPASPVLLHQYRTLGLGTGGTAGVVCDLGAARSDLRVFGMALAPDAYRWVSAASYVHIWASNVSAGADDALHVTCPASLAFDAAGGRTFAYVTQATVTARWVMFLIERGLGEAVGTLPFGLGRAWAGPLGLLTARAATWAHAVGGVETVGPGERVPGAGLRYFRRAGQSLPRRLEIPLQRLSAAEATSLSAGLAALGDSEQALAARAAVTGPSSTVMAALTVREPLFGRLEGAVEVAQAEPRVRSARLAIEGD